MALLHHSHPLRWSKSPCRSSLPSSSRSRPPSTNLRFSCSSASSRPTFRRPYTSVLIVPTGVGASIGGFAGDALPVARTLASVADCVISHPNVLNAAMLYWPVQNILYVEGYALDRFAEGSWALQPVHQNKVGLVLDAGIEDELRIRHLQVADATRASLGLPLVEYIVTDTPLQVEKWINPKSGQSTGKIKHPDSLLRAVHALVNLSQVNAVAVVGRFPDDDIEDMEDYRQGKGVDLLAGVEAIISHLVVKEFQIPCAHAPALSPLALSSLLSPRSAAEEIGYTFLPCVLAGLSSAPQYVARKHGSSCIMAGDVDSVILPIDACGGDGALAFVRSIEKSKPLIIAVQENKTVLDDTPDKLGIEAVEVTNYWEAIGVVAAHKAGVDPKSLKRGGIDTIRCRHILSSGGCTTPLPTLQANKADSHLQQTRSSAVVSAPDELVQAGNRTPTPKRSAVKLLDAFLQRYPSSVTSAVGSNAQMAYTHEAQSLLQPRSFAVKDEIFCLFEGSLENLASLKNQYGLGKSANEVVLVMEAYRALRDRAPYPTNHMLAHLSGSFAFIIFDEATSSVFVASDEDGRIPLFLGTTADGYLAFCDDAEMLRGACGKSLASFPPGCFFSTATGLRSYEHPKNKVTAVPAMEEEMCGATFKIERPRAKAMAE